MTTVLVAQFQRAFKDFWLSASAFGKQEGRKKVRNIFLNCIKIVSFYFSSPCSAAPISLWYRLQKSQSCGEQRFKQQGWFFFSIGTHIKGCLIFSPQAYPNKNKNLKGPSDKLENLGFLHSCVQNLSSWGCPRDLISTELTTVSPSVNGIIRNSQLFN